MKALVCTTPRQFDYINTEMPVTAEGETLLKIERIGICGTDLHAFEGTQPYFNYPRILGHELAATILETKAIGFMCFDIQATCGDAGLEFAPHDVNCADGYRVRCDRHRWQQ